MKVHAHHRSGTNRVLLQFSLDELLLHFLSYNRKSGLKNDVDLTE